MKQLSSTFKANDEGISKLLPNADYLNLPERVLQFGTGVLLRGLPDYFIDKANKQGVFNGRVIVVKSTASGGSDAFEQQDGMFTHLIRGVSEGKPVEQLLVNASISRVVEAGSQWNDILATAENPMIEIVISNTTEVGITLINESIHAAPPVSFPAKLLAVLYRRFVFFKGDTTKGMVIIPTELVPDNGRLLKSVCRELAILNALGDDFLHWFENHNFFCDSLVDRIVPGKLPAAQLQWLEEKTGYTDQLAIMSEPYALWAIEASHPEISKRLSFAAVNPEVVLAADINKFRQLKLHLLNGTHTFCCGVAILCGFGTVKNAMDDKEFVDYIQTLLQEVIIPGVVSEDISEQEAILFSQRVIDRFSNPFIDHYWQSISLNSSAKMKMRNLPVISSYYERNNTVPDCVSLAFAAMLVFLKSTHEANGRYYGTRNDNVYEIQDDRVALLNKNWVAGDWKLTAERLLCESSVWGMDLSKLVGFADAVAMYMEKVTTQDPRKVLSAFLKEQKTVSV